MLDKAGFKVVKILHVGNWQGILGSMQIFLNRNNGKTSLQGKLMNRFNIILSEQIARITNLIGQGDCIEIIAVKK